MASVKYWDEESQSWKLAGAGTDGADGGYYKPQVTQPDDNTMRVTYTPSANDMPSIPSVDVTLPVGAKGDPGYTPQKGIDYFDGNTGERGDDGGHYTPVVTQPEANIMQVDYTPSSEDMPAVDSVRVTIPVGPQGNPGDPGTTPHIGENGNWWIGEIDTGISATGKNYTLPVGGTELGGVKNGGNVTINEDGTMTVPDSSQNVTLTTAQINALDGMFQVCAFTKDDVSAEYAAFQAAFGLTDSGEDGGGDSGGSGEDSGGDDSGETEVTLTGISATYSGGDVAVGTALTDLTGIVVTAHYSDGNTETVTDYTLSGEIAEGENTVTVSYGGKSATFTVTGIAESTGENNGWVEGEAYDIEWTDGYGIDHNGSQGGGAIGAVFENTNRSVSDFQPCRGASAVNVSGIYTNYGVFFYDENQNFVVRQIVADYAAPVPVPLSAYYVRVQCGASNTESASVTPVMLELLSENTVWEPDKYYCLEWESGKQITGTGDVTDKNGDLDRNVSGFALCMGAATITASFKIKVLAAFYDGDKVLISTAVTSTTTNVMTVPDGAVYFRADTCGATDGLNTWVMMQ